MLRVNNVKTFDGKFLFNVCIVYNMINWNFALLKLCVSLVRQMAMDTYYHVCRTLVHNIIYIRHVKRSATANLFQFIFVCYTLIMTKREYRYSTFEVVSPRSYSNNYVNYNIFYTQKK